MLEEVLLYQRQVMSKICGSSMNLVAESDMILFS